MTLLAHTQDSYFLHRHRHKSCGFSLLELSIVIAIVSVVLGGSVMVSSNIVRHQSYDSTREKLALLQDALVDYQAANGRLPCVSPSTAPVDDPAFGVEILGGGCNGNATIPLGTWRVANGTEFVRIGAFPSRALGLPDQVAADEYGNRYLYAVTESHTSIAGFNGPGLGAIVVRDNAPTPNIVSSNASFLLLSHGENASGAFRHASGAQPGGVVPTAPHTNDNENADNDEIFISTRFNDSDPARYYDDVVTFLPKYRLRAQNLSHHETLEVSAPPRVPAMTSPISGNPVLNDYATSTITLTAPATVIITSNGTAELDVGAGPPENIGIIAQTEIVGTAGSAVCSFDRDFEGESTRGIFYASTTCVRRLVPDTYVLRSHISGIYDPLSLNRPYIVANSLQYVILK